MEIVASQSDSVRASRASEDASWQHAVRTAIRDPQQLCRILSLPRECEVAAAVAARSFGVFAPRQFVAKMRPGDPHDPLLRQVLPLREELQDVAGFTADPVGDRVAALRPGVIKKYHGRALLITTGTCAVHCRFCFRRHFPYAEAAESWEDWGGALSDIAVDSTVEEVLLSGGDPLSMVDSQLAALALQLAEIRHLRRLRVHTRLPIVIPQRVTPSLIAWLCGTRLTPIVVVHANHPAELDEAVVEALGRLIGAGVPVLNQAVLLRGVNDDVDVLAELCRRLVDARVMPYYLNQLDRVSGSAHFEVPLNCGRQLMQQLRARLPGYAVPKYVQELSGAVSKIPLA